MDGSAEKGRVLLLGSGSSKQAQLYRYPEEFQTLTLDVNPALEPDVVWDLEKLPYDFASDNTFDLVVAEEVLEHTGQQGDLPFFFGQFGELWRILKPGGRLCLSCPRYDRQWAWGDPGHKRVLTLDTFLFLSKKSYNGLGAAGNPMSDYRSYLGPQDWDISQRFYTETNLLATLVALK